MIANCRKNHHAGNDIQMPGCRENMEEIIHAVKSGEEKEGYKITLADYSSVQGMYCMHIVAKTINKKRKGKGSMVQQLLRFRGGNLYFPENFCVFVYLLLVILWYKY